MFFIIPTGVDYRTDRMPMVTFTLMGINTLVYLITFMLSLGPAGPEGVSSGEIWVYEHLWMTPAHFTLYSWVTSQFVHANIWHLLGNMMYLFLFGSCVEDIVGRWKYILLYLIGAAGADAFHILFVQGHFASEIPTGGASGAISACMGAFACLFLKTDINFRYFTFFFMRFHHDEFSLPAWLVMSFYFLKDLLFGVLEMMRHEEGGGSGVAFGAHVGGFVTGAGLILLFRGFFRKGEIEAAGPATAARYAFPNGDIYIFENDRQLGPYSARTLQEMLRVKALKPKSLYWVEGMEDWRPLSELKQ